MDEFKDVPAYVKGRITREYVNEMVDCIHNTLESKHKILSMPRHSMGDSMMRKYKAFKEAETGETQGLHFFIDGDVESMKIDSSWRAGLATLRTLKRIKEVRGGGIIRYAMI